MDCLFLGGIISVVVAMLKRIRFVDDHPKIVASLFSGIVAAVTAYAGNGDHAMLTLLVCFLTQLAGAITTHEVVLKQVNQNSSR